MRRGLHRVFFKSLFSLVVLLGAVHWSAVGQAAAPAQANQPHVLIQPPSQPPAPRGPPAQGQTQGQNRPDPNAPRHQTPTPPETPQVPGSSFPPELESIDAQFRATQPRGAPVDWIYFIVYRPTLIVNLSSPLSMYHSLFWQNLSNISDVKNGDATIGHFETAWSCASTPATNGRLPNSIQGGPLRGATGHTGDRTESAVEMIQNGAGMTPLFLDYWDGYLEPADMVNFRFLDHHEEVQMIAAAVTPADCRRVDAFFKQFQASGAERRFGLMADPAKFEGGVCWTTAEAATAHIPMLKAMFDSYLLSFGVPWKLMGAIPTPSPSPYARYPLPLQGQQFGPVPLDTFNEAFIDWNMPSQRNYPYRTFDFQAFGREFEERFGTCQRDWCQQGRRIGAQVVRVTSGSGLPTDALMLDARH